MNHGVINFQDADTKTGSVGTVLNDHFSADYFADAEELCTFAST